MGELIYISIFGIAITLGFISLLHRISLIIDSAPYVDKFFCVFALTCLWFVTLITILPRLIVPVLP